MQKLDQKFDGTIKKVKDGTLVPDDEYVVFLIKDDAFWAVLPSYLAHCRRLNANGEQIDAVMRLIKRGARWRNENADRCKTPDIGPGERLL